MDRRKQKGSRRLRAKGEDLTYVIFRHLIPTMNVNIVCHKREVRIMRKKIGKVDLETEEGREM